MLIPKGTYDWYRDKSKIVGIRSKSTYLLFIEHGGGEYLVLKLKGTKIYQVSRSVSALVRDFFYVEVI